MRTIRKLLPALCFLMMLFAPALVTPAAGQTVLYSQNFDGSATFPSDWSYYGSTAPGIYTASYSSSPRSASVPSGTIAYVTGLTVTDDVASFNWYVDANKRARFVFRGGDASNYYFLDCAYTSVATFRFSKVVGGVTTALGAAAITSTAPVAGFTNRVDVSFVGSTL